MAKKVVVAMSGGVDSAVAAYLMKESGFEVIGVTLRLAPDNASEKVERSGRCCSIDDMTDARMVCDKLDIPFYAIDAQSKFKSVVFDPFVEFYKNGLTPIPCLACNHEVKFGDLFACAQNLNADLATGHYAQVLDYNGFLSIAKPVDLAKDQTYYLYGTNAEIIKHLHFPLGKLLKPQVREIAKKIGLLVHDKKDSQEICFVPDGNHAKVVEKALKQQFSGNIIDEHGQKLGEHTGIHNFTVGQRRGLKVAAKERLFVADLNPSTQDVTLAKKSSLACGKIKLSNMRFIVPKEYWPSKVSIKIRARSEEQIASWHEIDNEFYFNFDEDNHSVALGQAGVIYAGDCMLGGGIISARLDGLFAKEVNLSI